MNVISFFGGCHSGVNRYVFPDAEILKKQLSRSFFDLLGCQDN